MVTVGNRETNLVAMVAVKANCVNQSSVHKEVESQRLVSGRFVEAYLTITCYLFALFPILNVGKEIRARC
jgi:hypothetical protein